MGKIKIKRDRYRGKELATHPFPTFWQNVNGHSVDLFNELEKLIAAVSLNVLYLHGNCCTIASIKLSALGF